VWGGSIITSFFSPLSFYKILGVRLSLPPPLFPPSLGFFLLCLEWSPQDALTYPLWELFNATFAGFPTSLPIVWNSWEFWTPVLLCVFPLPLKITVFIKFTFAFPCSSLFRYFSQHTCRLLGFFLLPANQNAVLNPAHCVMAPSANFQILSLALPVLSGIT